MYEKGILGRLLNKKLTGWLSELDNEIELVSSDDINKEARENMFSFSISDDELEVISENELVSFLESCKEICQKRNDLTPKLFYSWVDGMAGQLRFSVVSKSHDKLPFSIPTKRQSVRVIAFDYRSLVVGDYPKGGELSVWVCEI